MVPLLSEDQVRQKIAQGLNSLPIQSKRVLVLIPDPTRTMPLPLFFRAIMASLQGRASQVDFLVALGTHPPLGEAELLALVGVTAAEKAAQYPQVHLFNTPGTIQRCSLRWA